MCPVALETPASTTVGPLVVTPFPHPQGCRGYLVAEPTSRQALAIDPHLDAVEAMSDAVQRDGLSLVHVVDTHTHADHPSGAAALAARFSATFAGHPASGLFGVARLVADGDALELGRERVVVRHAPGHTPDHVVLLSEGAVFSGDSLFIGGVARTDFLGGDAGQLHETLRGVFSALPDETLVFPGHDYQGRLSSTLAAERATNPWLTIQDRGAFARALTAKPAAPPANMDDLLRLNREGVQIPSRVPVRRAIELAVGGASGRIVDVRTDAEVEAESVPGSLHVPLDQVGARADAIRAVPAPRMLLCRSGARAERARQALESAGVQGLQVIDGGIEAWKAAGGSLRRGRGGVSLERQVRLVAGVLIVLGTALALVHPAYLAIPALVGAGLTLSGITNRRGMALVLTRMPWNRSAAAGAGAPPTGGTCAAGPPPTGGGTCAAPPPSAR